MNQLVKKGDISQYINYQSEPSDWHKVTQEQIKQFADCTLDKQFIHVDPEAAKTTPYGTTIAHGFLTLSMLSHFAKNFSIEIEGFYMAVNAGFDKIRFLQPVKVDRRIRAQTKILNIEEQREGQYRIKTEVTIEIEGTDKPALVAEWLGIQMVK